MLLFEVTLQGRRNDGGQRLFRVDYVMLDLANELRLQMDVGSLTSRSPVSPLLRRATLMPRRIGIRFQGLRCYLCLPTCLLLRDRLATPFVVRIMSAVSTVSVQARRDCTSDRTFRRALVVVA